MFRKPEREFKSLNEYKSGMAAGGRTFFKESKAIKAYMTYLQWYRREMTLYREKMSIVNVALGKLTIDEVNVLRQYFR